MKYLIAMRKLFSRFAVDCRSILFKQKTENDLRMSDWSSDVCSSDLFDNRHCDAGGMSRKPLASPLAATFAATYACTCFSATLPQWPLTTHSAACPGAAKLTAPSACCVVAPPGRNTTAYSPGIDSMRRRSAPASAAP